MCVCVCRYSVPWAGNQGQIPWLAVLDVRFENSTGVGADADADADAEQEAEEKGAAEKQQPSSTTNALADDVAAPPLPTAVYTPWQNVTTNAGDGVYTLFKWIAFNQSYETFFPPFDFDAPATGFRQAKLVTVLSGECGR